MVNEGVATEIVRRETNEDLLLLDLPLSLEPDSGWSF